MNEDHFFLHKVVKNHETKGKRGRKDEKNDGL